MQKIECVFGKKFDGQERQLELFMKTSGGCYFRDEDGMYLLCDAKYGEIYFSVGCPDVQNLLHTIDLSVGKTYRYKEGLLLGQVVLIATRNVRDCLPQEYRFRRDEAFRLLAERGRGALADAFLGKKARDETSTALCKVFEAICFAFQEGRKDAAAEIIFESVGLGRGLTPDFDDFLIGLMYTFRESGMAEQWAPIFDAVAASLHNTTQVSAEFLKCALQGRAFSPVTDILRGGGADAVSTLLNAGHSSGSSMMVGILTADRFIGERNHAVL